MLLAAILKLAQTENKFVPDTFSLNLILL
jgi:hypothetical protein